MMKRIIIICLLIITCCQLTEAYTFKSNGICYNVLSYSQRTCEVTWDNVNKIKYEGNIVIPEYAEWGQETYHVVKVGINAFSECPNLLSVEIPDCVLEVYTGVFRNCTNLNRVKLPENITDILGECFYHCESLESISMPQSVKTIGGGAFQGCHSLKYIELHEGITKIFGTAFQGCSSFTSLTLPSTITHISLGAFRGCPNLTEVTCLFSEIPSYHGGGGGLMFDTNVLENCVLKVPEESIAIFKESQHWGLFKNIIGFTSGIYSPTVSNSMMNGRTYNLNGFEIKENSKGIVIKNGKKYVNH